MSKEVAKGYHKQWSYFSNETWSAQMINNAEEGKVVINSLQLEGRTIKYLNLVGRSYFHTRDDIEDYAYNVLEKYDEPERQLRSSYANIDRSIMYPRTCLVYEPLIIEFEDGDSLAVLAKSESVYKLGINSIPRSVDTYLGERNLDANVIFSPCLGATIESVQLPMIGESEGSENKSFSIRFLLDNGTSLEIGGAFDGCVVTCFDKDGSQQMISFMELKTGLFNWEDLHTDEETGFVADSPTVFFGQMGSEHVVPPYISLCPDNDLSRARMHINYGDFFLLDWSISILKKERYQGLENYSFTEGEWLTILDTAEKTISFSTFDKMFDYVVSLNVRGEGDYNIMLGAINSVGPAVWSKKESLRVQIRDIREWSNKVLPVYHKMEVEGF